jgi:hypothetical protein
VAAAPDCFPLRCARDRNNVEVYVSIDGRPSPAQADPNAPGASMTPGSDGAMRAGPEMITGPAGTPG